MSTLSYNLSLFALNAAWQMPLIVAAAALGNRLLRRSAAWRQHWLWQGALLLSLALPAITVISISSTDGDGAFGSPAVMVRSATAPAPASATTVASTNGWSFSPRRLAVALDPSVEWQIATVLLLAGLIRALWITRQWTAARAVLRTAVEDANLAGQVRTACEQSLGLAPIPVLTTKRLAGPVTLGFWKPVILLPENFGNGDVLLSALGHEMAHIRRRDYAVNLLHEILLLPLTLHPASLLLRRKLEQTREMACDDLVTEKILDARRYARSLVAIAVRIQEQVSVPATAQPALGVTDGDNLQERVERLIVGRRQAGGIKIAACILLLAVAGSAALLGSVASAPPQAAGTEQPASRAGVWRGEDGKTKVLLRLTARGAEFSGNLQFQEPPVPPPPPERKTSRKDMPPAPPPPPPRPLSGDFTKAVLTGDTLRVAVKGIKGQTAGYRVRFTGQDTAVLQLGPESITLVREK